MCLCAFGAFAQGTGGKAVVRAGTKATATQGDLALRVARGFQQQTLRTSQSSVVLMAQLVDSPEQPLLRVRLPQAEVAALGVNPPVLQARLLYSDEVFNYTNLTASAQLYVPQAFVNEKRSWYRGMELNTFDEIKNILVNGLEVEKVHFYEGNDGVYVSAHLPVAMSYAIAAEYVRQPGVNGEEDFYMPQSFSFRSLHRIPVVVSVPVTLAEARAYSLLSYEYEFFHTILPSNISHVMTFLEVNGKTDWYEAVLENNELVLVKVPAGLTSGYLGYRSFGIHE